MKKILLISIILNFNISFSQNLKFYGFLPILNQTGKINKKTNYNLFISTTLDSFNQNINGIEYPATDLQFYLQPSIIYIFSPKINYSLSYTYQRNNPFNENYLNEHRICAQIAFLYNIANSRLSNRLRLEERFIENKINNSYPFSTRLRYQIGFNTPFKNKDFYLNTYNEFYFSLTGAKNATYSENWAYIGCGYKIGKTSQLEVGYLNQIAVRNKQKDLRFLNLLQIMWITNFNFKKNN